MGDELTPQFAPLSEFEAAATRLAPHIHHTPIVRSRSLSSQLDIDIAFKAESFQKTGSFKPRGIYNKAATTDGDLITISAGNAAAALAWAGRKAGKHATVVMPSSASQTKIDACRTYGAEVVMAEDVHGAFDLVHRLTEEEGLDFVHPFDDPHVVLGHGSIALELLADVPDLAAVIVPVGGGGLISGIAAALEAADSTAEVFGVEPIGACAMRMSIENGKATKLDSVSSVADGLAPPMAGEINYDIVRRRVREVVTVNDEEIMTAMHAIHARLKIVVEPSGAAGLAALQAGAIRPPSGPSVVVLSGGNLDANHLTYSS